MESLLEFFKSVLENEKIMGPIITIIVSLIVYKVIKNFIKKVLLRKEKNNSYEYKRRRTVVELFTNFLKILIFIIASLYILKIYGVDTTSIIASLGVASAVIGLAFQDTLKDVINGVTIILENYFIVGDYIEYNGFTGEVVSFGFKSTKIKNFNNEILTVSNRNITQIVNLSQSKASVIISIPVAYEEDIEHVENVLDKIVKEIEKDKDVEASSCEYLGVSELGESAVNYLIKFIAGHDKQWKTKRSALRVIKLMFDKEGIKIPYNQIEVHNGKNL